MTILADTMSCVFMSSSLMLGDEVKYDAADLCNAIILEFGRSSDGGVSHHQKRPAAGSPASSSTHL